jgi:hypothetical protein
LLAKASNSAKAAGVTADKAFAPYPKPLADPEIVASVDADGLANFQIVDDGPTPDQVLAQKKFELILTVTVGEHTEELRHFLAGRSTSLNAIASWSKRQQLEIEGLDAETVDGWKMKATP